MIPKLIIDGLVIPILKEIPVSVNFSISNIRDIEKRGGAMSKTITLPDSKEIRRVFENIFNVNIELSTYDPNVAVEGIYYVNEKEQIKGDVQLLKIIDKPNGSREYQCNIIGRESAFFLTLGELKLTDLDFSDLDHTYNKTEQKNSWATSYRLSGVATAFSYGAGYVYPLIKYGYSSSDSSYDVNHFKPAIPAREYLVRIFADAGYTWTSTFLDSAFFKRLYVPCNKDKIALDSTTISNSQYFIGKTAATVTGWQSGTTAGGGLGSWANTTITPDYDLETGSYFDNGSQYDNITTFTATIANSGVYNIVAFNQMDLKVNAPSLVGGYWNAASMGLRTTIYVNGVIKAAITQGYNSGNVLLGVASTLKSSAQTGNIALVAGDVVEVKILLLSAIFYTKDSGLTPTNAAYTIDYTLPNGTQKNEHYLLRTDPTVVDGNPLAMNNAIPENVKQKDFVKWIMTMFKLNVELDKTNETNLIIEPESNGWYTGSVDWTKLVDYNKDWETAPMGELDFRNYIFKYKDDKDYYNDLYQKQYIDNYGLKRLTVTNDFIKNEKKLEIGFSPTPLVGNNTNNIICPHIYQKDGVNLKPASHNIRLLYYGGLKNSGNAWSYVGASGTTTETQYPYMGHVDDPLTPTLDLNFDYPKEVYYSYISAYYTTNGLYNAYYSQFINEITDKDSKIITCYVNLKELDIMQFTFRKKVFIDNPTLGAGYYIVNKIYDYNPTEAKSTKVELLKVKRYDAFTPDAIPIDPGYDPVSSARVSYNPINNANNNLVEGNNIGIGDNNRIMGSGNMATGSTGCFVDETSTGVTLINCTDVSVVGGSNIVIMNATGRAYDSTYDGMVINTGVTTAAQTADFTIDPDVTYYEIDCTAGNITASYDLSTYDYENRIIYFNRIDSSANTFTLDEPSGTTTIAGDVFPYDTTLAQWEDLPVILKGIIFRAL